MAVQIYFQKICIQVKNVAQIIWNQDPGFVYDDNTLENDFVILKLGSPLEFNQDVQPACLPPSANYLDINSSEDRCFTSGWGSLQEGKCVNCKSIEFFKNSRNH